MTLITRQAKGSKLSFEEMDGNLKHLDSQASKWENKTITTPATKAALAIVLAEPTDGVVLTIGDISYEFDLTLDESVIIKQLDQYNKTNNVAQIIFDGKGFQIVANEAGAAGNNIFVSISGIKHTYYEYDPETNTIGANLFGVQGNTTLRGGSDETLSETNYIKPKNKKKIDASIIENLVESTSIEGTHYLYVAGNGTPTENATELQNAYDTAKTLTPNGNPLAADNRVKIIVGTGKYEFLNSNPFTLDTQYIDIVSLTGDADVFLYTTNANDKVTIQDNIIVNTNNIFIKGIDASTEVWLSKELPIKSGKFHITGDLENLALENCTGGDFSFGSGTASGTFTNCTGGDGSFGYEEASGTFTNCTGGANSFGSNGTASGTFTNCTGGVGSFGSNGTASGTFTNCTGGDNSFGYVEASGTFTNCTGGANSFGSGGTLTGTLKFCTLTTGTFPVSGNGAIYYSIDDSTVPL